MEVEVVVGKDIHGADLEIRLFFNKRGFMLASLPLPNL